VRISDIARIQIPVAELTLTSRMLIKNTSCCLKSTDCSRDAKARLWLKMALLYAVLGSGPVLQQPHVGIIAPTLSNSI
jgi:hypothetical protein